MSANEPMISLAAVSCDLGGVRILDGVDLELRQGEITVVLGPSGAGKSTLLRAIAGFEPVSGGTISSPNGELSTSSRTAPPEHRKIGFVVQSFALFPHMTAQENVRFGLDKGASAGVASEWLDRVKLADRSSAYPHELSGGEQQRVALARALAREPDIVLLDEAFSSLDQQLRKSVRREAKELLRDAGAAVLAVTHDPDEAMELADRIVILDRGKVLQAGAPQELYWQPQSAIAARLLGEVNELPGTWKGTAFATEFGQLDLQENGPKDAQTALIRPAAAMAVEDFSGTAEVLEANFAGGSSEITLQGKNGGILRVSGGFGNKLKPGSRATIKFDLSRIGWDLSR